MAMALGHSLSKARSSAPEPVPRSAMRRACWRRSPRAANAVSTTVSVSGRGTNVSSLRLNGSPQNSLTPRMRATGSCARRRCASAVMAVRSDDVTWRAPWLTMPAASRLSAWPTRMRASSSGESSAAAAKARASVCRADAMVSAAVNSRSDKPSLLVRTAFLSAAQSRVAGLCCQQLSLMLGHQRVDDLAQRLALDDLRQLVERKIDAMIADPSLRKIVGADALGAVSGSDLAAPLGSAFGVTLLPLEVVKSGTQD